MSCTFERSNPVVEWLQGTRKQCTALVTESCALWLDLLVPSCNDVLVPSLVHALTAALACPDDGPRLLLRLIECCAVEGLAAALVDALRGGDDPDVEPGTPDPCVPLVNFDKFDHARRQMLWTSLLVALC